MERIHRATDPAGSREGGESGQTLVEFAMVIPMVVVMLMALLELALGLNASMAVNRASQHGAHIAASGGNVLGTDCLILERVEKDMGAPNTASNISQVVVERTALVGNLSYAQQTWGRHGETDCVRPDGTTVKVPYTLDINGYPEAQRCTVLGGCPSLTPARSSVDNIGVIVRYTHDWKTPLNGALDLLSPGSGGGGGGGWTFEQRNIFRIEPTL
jgi:Flp pilus assembly protein TadG